MIIDTQSQPLKDRIEKALADFTSGRASMHVPPLDTDVDMVLTDCQSQLTALTSQLESVVAENAALKAAFDKPQAYLSWHAIPPTWEDPLPCGEYLDVHDEAGHKNSDGTDCWPVFAKPEIETPATSAFLAEVREQVWIEAKDFTKSMLACDSVDHLDFLFDGKVQQLRQGGAA